MCSFTEVFKLLEIVIFVDIAKDISKIVIQLVRMYAKVQDKLNKTRIMSITQKIQKDVKATI